MERGALEAQYRKLKKQYDEEVERLSAENLNLRKELKRSVERDEGHASLHNKGMRYNYLLL
jgi:hypothetical protein